MQRDDVNYLSSANSHVAAPPPEATYAAGHVHLAADGYIPYSSDPESKEISSERFALKRSNPRVQYYAIN